MSCLCDVITWGTFEFVLVRNLLAVRVQVSKAASVDSVGAQTEGEVPEERRGVAALQFVCAPDAIISSSILYGALDLFNV